MRNTIWLSCALLFACTANPPARAPQPRTSSLAAVADSIVHNSPLRRAQLGIAVYDRASGTPLYTHNPEMHLVPASNTKLIVTAVAMGLLGPEFRYRTPLFATGASGDSAIAALLVKGSGDPTWSARYHGSDTRVLEQLADSVYASGARRIDVLLADVSYLGPASLHWTWMIGDLPETFAAPVGSLAMGEASLHISVRGGAQVGDTARGTLLGVSDFVPVVSTIRTDTAGASFSTSIDYEAWPDTIRLSGRIAVNRSDTVSVAAPNVERFALAALRDALVARGVRVGSIEVTRDSLRAAALGANRVVATWTSVPLTDIIAGILLPSQNWIAEQLLLTLGKMHARSASWTDALQVERRYLIDVARIDSTAFFLADASGLSTQNLFTAQAFVQLLEHTQAQPWGAAYRAALPTPMQRGSTLSNRFQGLEGSVSAKTGSMTHVTALSGFVRHAAGRDMTFSFLVNASGLSQAEVRRGMDAVVRALAASTAR